MSRKKTAVSMPRTVALCYVRLSLTRDESDLNSPERQRANIQAECDRRGWTPEWYEDVEGHKSGAKEDNRPGCLALKARLSDPDVAAVVANDLSRLHRKGWRVGSLLDFLEQHQVGLVLAAPGRNLDFSGATGKINTMLMALMDEYYAADTAQKQLDSIRHRRGKGIIVGPIPFGTVRGKDRYLKPSTEGIWLLPDGQALLGEQGDQPPQEGALWRGFFEAARRCLELYAGNVGGRRKIAELLNREGYRFRDGDGQVALFSDDDVRRVSLNWVEYGGAVLPGRARSRRASDLDVEQVKLNPERAVMDVAVCYQVGLVWQQRTRARTTPDHGVRTDAAVYPLSRLFYCAHCERAAQEAGDSSRRAYLTGKTGNKHESRRYRHNTERTCAAKHRSVNAEVLEQDFRRILEGIAVREEALPLLVQAVEHFTRDNRQEERKNAIQAEIAYWRQRAQNADTMFFKARLSEQDWQDTIETADREIARLQALSAEQVEAEVALRLTTEMISNLVQHWHQGSPQDRRGLAHSLFEYLVYDLDTQQITDFKLKPWAELLMQLKVTLDDSGDSEAGTEGKPTVLSCTRRATRPYHVTPCSASWSVSWSRFTKIGPFPANQQAA